MPHKTIKIIVADDHTLFRSCLRSLLDKKPNLDIIGEAANGQELMIILKKQHPDLILMDLQMPGMNGIEAIEQIKQEYPHIKIIVLSMFDNEGFIIHSLELGVNAYLLKNADPGEIVSTIDTVMVNEFCFNQYVTNIMRKNLFGKRNSIPCSDNPVEFTKRESQIIKLVCRQMTNYEIGEELHLSPRTVEGHRKRILDKIGAKNIVGLVRFAIKSGIVEMVN